MTTDTSFPVVADVNNDEVMSGISEKTFQSWLKTHVVKISAVRIWCVLYAKHCERLHCFRNFSGAFVNGITGSALKRDALPFKLGAGK